MKPKKVPMRMCVGCREMKPKRELVRIVRSPQGEVHVDTTSKAQGRGAYICPDCACLEKAQKNKGLERAFEQKVPAEVFETLRGEIQTPQ